jgi:hypothetical protein
VAAASDGKTFSTVSTVGFVAGAAIAGAGLYLLLTADAGSRRAALHVSPSGAALTGAF